MTVPTNGYIEFDTAVLPPGERFDAWASAMPFYDVSAPDPLAFEARVRAWFLPPLIVTESWLSPVHFVRTSDRIRLDRIDGVTLQYLVNGHYAGNAAGRAFVARTGDIAMQDRAQPLETIATSVHVITLTFDQAYLDDVLPGADVHGVVLRGGLAPMLRSALAVLPETLDAAGNDADEIARLLLDLIAATLRRDGHYAAEDSSRDPALRDRVRRYVSRNLAASLDIASVCAALSVSRSSLYRAMEQEGGFAGYVQRRRLIRLHRLLRDPAERRPIARLAALYGFDDKSHFSRLFRQTFHCSPGSLRERRRAEDSAPDGTPQQIFNSWSDADAAVSASRKPD